MKEVFSWIYLKCSLFEPKHLANKRTHIRFIRFQIIVPNHIPGLLRALWLPDLPSDPEQVLLMPAAGPFPYLVHHNTYHILLLRFCQHSLVILSLSSSTLGLPYSLRIPVRPNRLRETIAAVKSVHPYEEPVFNLVPFGCSRWEM